MNLDLEWNRLVGEYDAAFERQQNAWASVQKKFAKIFTNQSRENPSADELDELEAAQASVKEADRAMREFVRLFAG